MKMAFDSRIITALNKNQTEKTNWSTLCYLYTREQGGGKLQNSIFAPVQS